MKEVLTATHTTLKGKRKDWLARNQDNVSKWEDCCFVDLAP